MNVSPIGGNEHITIWNELAVNAQLLSDRVAEITLPSWGSE